MAFKIFLSHSVAPRELVIVYATANEGAKRGASPFIPDRDWDPKREIPDRIESHLKEADYFLAIATSSGFHFEWLNREVQEAKKEKRPLLLVVDREIKVPPKLTPIRIDRMNPAKTVHQVAEHLEKYRKDKDTKQLLTWLGVGGILFLLFLGSKE